MRNKRSKKKRKKTNRKKNTKKEHMRSIPANHLMLSNEQGINNEKASTGIIVIVVVMIVFIIIVTWFDLVALGVCPRAAQSSPHAVL
jgi:uncharacterized oligopeptide transporter (OPT) family protein